jgi:hypothetical protein
MRDRFRNLHLICGAILGGLVLANLALVILLVRGGLTQAPVPKTLSIILFAIGVAVLVAAPAVKGAVFKRAGAEGFGPDIGKVFAAYQKANLVAFALREAGGLIGFVLALTTANPWWSWGLGGAAVIAMVVDWPRQEHLGV